MVSRCQLGSKTLEGRKRAACPPFVKTHRQGTQRDGGHFAQAKAVLDQLTKAYIREHLSNRFTSRLAAKQASASVHRVMRRRCSAATRKVPSDLGRLELVKLPAPASRGHLPDANVA